MLNTLLQNVCNRVMRSRPPDVVIGDPDHPYLLRWWVWKRNKWLNLYLHRILRSDDDRALHDHPWVNMSYIVEGEYNEVTFKDGQAWSEELDRTLRKQGTFKFRLPTSLHRLELIDKPKAWSSYKGDQYLGEVMMNTPQPCTTLFLTGPRVRIWGFSCLRGWVKWTDFTQKTLEGTFIAKGCGDIDPKLLAPTAAKSGFWPKEPEGLGTPSKGRTPTDTATRAGVVNRSV